MRLTFVQPSQPRHVLTQPIIVGPQPVWMRPVQPPCPPLRSWYSQPYLCEQHESALNQGRKGTGALTPTRRHARVIVRNAAVRTYSLPLPVLGSTSNRIRHPSFGTKARHHLLCWLAACDAVPRPPFHVYRTQKTPAQTRVTPPSTRWFFLVMALTDGENPPCCSLAKHAVSHTISFL